MVLVFGQIVAAKTNALELLAGHTRFDIFRYRVFAAGQSGKEGPSLDGMAGPAVRRTSVDWVLIVEAPTD